MLVKKQLYLFNFSAACCFMTALNFLPSLDFIWAFESTPWNTRTIYSETLFLCICFCSSLSSRDGIFLFPPKLQPWHFQFCFRRLFLWLLCRLSTPICRRYSFSWISDQSCSLPRISFFVIEEFEATPGNFSKSAASKLRMLVTDFFSLLL